MTVKIAKTGGNALTDAIKDLSMTTEAKSLKIAFEDSWSQAVTAGGLYIKQITHNLGYTPCFRVNGQNDPAQSFRFLYPNATGAVLALVYADSTKLYIKLEASGFCPDGTISGYYFIFEDKQ